MIDWCGLTSTMQNVQRFQVCHIFEVFELYKVFGPTDSDIGFLSQLHKLIGMVISASEL
jgi:hypothetical protein